MLDPDLQGRACRAHCPTYESDYSCSAHQDYAVDVIRRGREDWKEASRHTEWHRDPKPGLFLHAPRPLAPSDCLRHDIIVHIHGSAYCIEKAQMNMAPRPCSHNPRNKGVFTGFDKEAACRGSSQKIGQWKGAGSRHQAPRFL